MPNIKCSNYFCDIAAPPPTPSQPDPSASNLTMFVLGKKFVNTGPGIVFTTLHFLSN